MQIGLHDDLGTWRNALRKVRSFLKSFLGRDEESSKSPSLVSQQTSITAHTRQDTPVSPVKTKPTKTKPPTPSRSPRMPYVRINSSGELTLSGSTSARRALKFTELEDEVITAPVNEPNQKLDDKAPITEQTQVTLNPSIFKRKNIISMGMVQMTSKPNPHNIDKKIPLEKRILQFLNPYQKLHVTEYFKAHLLQFFTAIVDNGELPDLYETVYKAAQQPQSSMHRMLQMLIKSETLWPLWEKILYNQHQPKPLPNDVPGFVFRRYRVDEKLYTDPEAKSHIPPERHPFDIVAGYYYYAKSYLLGIFVFYLYRALKEAEKGNYDPALELLKKADHHYANAAIQMIIEQAEHYKQNPYFDLNFFIKEAITLANLVYKEKSENYFLLTDKGTHFGDFCCIDRAYNLEKEEITAAIKQRTNLPQNFINRLLVRANYAKQHLWISGYMHAADVHFCLGRYYNMLTKQSTSPIRIKHGHDCRRTSFLNKNPQRFLNVFKLFHEFERNLMKRDACFSEALKLIEVAIMLEPYSENIIHNNHLGNNLGDSCCFRREMQNLSDLKNYFAKYYRIHTENTHGPGASDISKRGQIYAYHLLGACTDNDKPNTTENLSSSEPDTSKSRFSSAQQV